ncbi:MAG: hypothetical protein U9Q37_02310 [Euryarchaeota archaeon]|nr:hypothetical protein [Euryarchaeota archaeon]
MLRELRNVLPVLQGVCCCSFTPNFALQFIAADTGNTPIAIGVDSSSFDYH